MSCVCVRVCIAEVLIRMFITEDYPLDYLYYLDSYMSGLKSSNSDYSIDVWVGTKYASHFHVLIIQTHTTPAPGSVSVLQAHTGALGIDGKRRQRDVQDKRGERALQSTVASRSLCRAHVSSVCL